MVNDTKIRRRDRMIIAQAERRILKEQTQRLLLDSVITMFRSDALIEGARIGRERKYLEKLLSSRGIE
jgi:hypothetical protein